MKIKTKLKEYFTERPKSSFWMWAFVTLFFFKYFTPSAIIFISMFQVGLLTPDIDSTKMNVTHQRIADDLADNYVDLLYNMQEKGRNFSQKNPFAGKILFHTLSYFIWATWCAMLFLILNLLRYGISWLYNVTRRITQC